MKRNKVIIGLIITLVFITGCSNFRYVPDTKRGKPIPVITTTVYSGNFSTEQIRGLWMTCSVRFNQVDPRLPQAFIHRHCDCYADLIRKDYKNSDDLRALSPEGANTLKHNLVTNCNLKIQQEFNYQKPLDPT